MDNYIRKLIGEGEHQKLDFKYAINDSRKIARTLAAFSNSDGGRLLIGVRDNGSIAGIRSDEEIYMVETASHLFCRPEVKFTTKQHTVYGKTILEVEVIKGVNKPYKAKDEEGRWVAYFRQNDQNLVANRVLIQVWKKEIKPKGVRVKFGKAENILMDHLKKYGSITISRFRKISGTSAYRAESIFANLIIFGIIRMMATEKGVTYELSNLEQDIALIDKTSFNY